MEPKPMTYRQMVNSGKTCICGHIASKHEFDMASFGQMELTYFCETSGCECEMLMLWTPSDGWRRI